MPCSLKILIPLCVAGALASSGLAVAQTATKTQPTARELFYHGRPAPDDARAPKSKSQGKSTKGGASKSGAQQGGTQQGGAQQDGAQLAGAQIIKASDLPPGITYTLQKAVGDSMVAVSPDAVFHTGDKINFVVQTNNPGYLYIASKGPTGEWHPLFPSSDIEDGGNRARAFHKYTVPRVRIEFTEPSGIENVFILFSPQPVDDVEKLLGTRKSGDGAGASKPVSVAKADIPDSLVDRLRSTYNTRDLVLEKVDDDKPGANGEKAIYVVNPTGSPDSHVWADLKLVHK